MKKLGFIFHDVYDAHVILHNESPAGRGTSKLTISAYRDGKPELIVLDKDKAIHMIFLLQRFVDLH